MTTNQRLDKLRELMSRENWDAVIVSGSDPHNSEYLAPRWQVRRWISGFTGSAGTVVITKDEAGLWTDSRYFIQAAQELEGSGITLFKMGLPETEDFVTWLGKKCRKGYTIVIDGTCTTHNFAEALVTELESKGAVIQNEPDYISRIWEDRPEIPDGAIRLLPLNISGRSRADKLDYIRKTALLEDNGYILLSSLDEIAWTTNLRGSDIDYNPLLISYMIIGMDDAVLFTDNSNFTAKDKDELGSEGISIRPYDSITGYIGDISQKRGTIQTDLSVTNHNLFCHLEKAFGIGRITDRKSPVGLAKSIKNATEIAGMKKAGLKDGIALTRFFFWLEAQMRKVRRNECTLSETEAAEKLRDLRFEVGAFNESFGTISAYGANAALPHYSATKGKESYLEPKGLYLVDSGGQYPYGTTDVTRTVPLGKLSKEEKTDYTLALKGMIALSMAHFPKGTRGTNLDVLARNAMWMMNKNYGHGTGHGVGHILCVHEGPQAIRHNWVDCELLPGMITSNEPGLYIEGSHGIRHENLILCKECTRNGFGTWLEFETITFVHINTAAIDIQLLNHNEIKWINDYNRTVFRKLGKYLSSEEQKWLQKQCAEIRHK